MKLVGIDSQSVDPADSKTLDSHMQLLAHDLRVLENLVLDDVEAGDYELIALAAEADNGVRVAGARGAEIAMMTRDDCLQTRRRAIRSRRCASCSRSIASIAKASSTSTATRSACCRRARSIERRDVVESEWGAGLIRSWNTAGWITLSQRIGDKIAALVGAGPGELIVADSTSINLLKALDAAMWLSRPGRKRIVSERSNFPTDLYIAETLADERGMELVARR